MHCLASSRKLRPGLHDTSKHEQMSAIPPRIYLDYNAGAPVSDKVRAAVAQALDLANPSSVHREGQAARQAVEEARAAVARLVEADPAHVVFTSGATEAASTLLTPYWTMGRAPLRMSKLYVGATEHPCVLRGGRFAAGDVEILPVDASGLIVLDALHRRLATHDRDAGLPLVAVQAANNETGVLQPLKEISAIVHEAGGVLVVDAVQAAGRLPIRLGDRWGDFLFLSGHKIGAPKGIGVLVGASDLMMPLPLIAGGGQEKGHRAGTENVCGIVGLGVAAGEARAALGHVAAVRALRDRLEHGIAAVAPQAVVHGVSAPRLCNTTFFSIPGLKTETAQIAFDLAGFAVSAGAACSSGKLGPSHVLAAMGVEAAAGALRVSIGPATTQAEIDAFLTALARIAGRGRAEVRAA
jgi:cysteine desulfurase